MKHLVLHVQRGVHAASTLELECAVNITPLHELCGFKYQWRCEQQAGFVCCLEATATCMTSLIGDATGPHEWECVLLVTLLWMHTAEPACTSVATECGHKATTGMMCLHMCVCSVQLSSS